jgi:hypothetical protein
MNIHECVSCAHDLNNHGDVQIKRVGRLTRLTFDNHTAISGPIFFMYGLKYAETLQF